MDPGFAIWSLTGGGRRDCHCLRLGQLPARFRKSWRWGLGCLLFPPALLPLACIEGRRARWPLVMLASGICVVASTYGVNYYVTHHHNLGAREKVVDGDIHNGTPTGWDGHDYAILETCLQAVVLQMANPDVT